MEIIIPRVYVIYVICIRQVYQERHQNPNIIITRGWSLTMLILKFLLICIFYSLPKKKSIIIM